MITKGKASKKHSPYLQPRIINTFFCTLLSFEALISAIILNLMGLILSCKGTAGYSRAMVYSNGIAEPFCHSSPLITLLKGEIRWEYRRHLQGFCYLKYSDMTAVHTFCGYGDGFCSKLTGTNRDPYIPHYSSVCLTPHIHS